MLGTSMCIWGGLSLVKTALPGLKKVNLQLWQGAPYLVGEAESLGELADLAQRAQVLVQAADGFLDVLAVGGLGGPCRQNSRAGQG